MHVRVVEHMPPGDPALAFVGYESQEEAEEEMCRLYSR
jgi:hypothetical protein